MQEKRPEVRFAIERMISAYRSGEKRADLKIVHPN